MEKFTYSVVSLFNYGPAPLLPTYNIHTTFSNGCLGSHNDEERSEMRYVVRIARPRESSNL